LHPTSGTIQNKLTLIMTLTRFPLLVSFPQTTPPRTSQHHDTTTPQHHAADNYCPGGPVGGAGNVVNKCPPGTATTSTGSSTISQCLVPPGSYYDGSKLVACTAGSYCTGGPVDGAGSKQTSCPAGDTSNPGAAALGECFPACAAPNLVCPAGCIDPFTDSKNCGTCGNTCKDANTCFGGTCSCGAAGNVCPAGATCKPFGTTQTPTCICDAFAQPVFVPEPLAIGQKVYVDNLVKASWFAVVSSPASSTDQGIVATDQEDRP